MTKKTEFLKEAELLMSLRPHKNVTAFLGFVVQPLCIITEFLAGGSLEGFLASEAKLDMRQVIDFAKDITAGMVHLHSEGIIHRDLASRNLLLDDKLGIKISDFGLSRVIGGKGESGVTKSETGPLKFMSPEALVHQRYSSKSDVYSFAIVMIEMLTRQEPWPNETAVSVAIAVGRDDQRPSIPDFTPPKIKEIIQKCWATEPTKRPEFGEVHELLEQILLEQTSIE